MAGLLQLWAALPTWPLRSHSAPEDVRLPSVETCFYCLQTFLSLDVQCRDDASKLK